MASIRPHDRLSVDPVLHFRSLSPTGSPPFVTHATGGVAGVRSVGRSIRPHSVARLQCGTSSHWGSSAASRAHGRRLSQSHFSYCFIIRVVKRRRRRHQRSEGGGERGRERGGQSFINTYIYLILKSQEWRVWEISWEC